MNETIPILKVEDLNIEYINDKGDKRIIVENGRFEIYPGEIVLIVGENGCGKSSILRSIVGDSSNNLLLAIKNKIKNIFRKEKLIVNHSQNLYFMGKKIDSLEEHDLFKTQLGYSRQEDDIDSFYERNVWNNVLDYASHSIDFQNITSKELEEKVQKVYDDLKCNKYCDGKLKRMRLKNCSGGEKKIVSILSALSRTESKLFILDEPINNLDAYHARRLNNYLCDLKEKKNPPGILIITHCPMFTNVDRTYELKRGKLTIKEKQNCETKTCFGECDEGRRKYIEEE